MKYYLLVLSFLFSCGRSEIISSYSDNGFIASFASDTQKIKKHKKFVEVQNRDLGSIGLSKSDSIIYIHLMDKEDSKDTLINLADSNTRLKDIKLVSNDNKHNTYYYTLKSFKIKNGNFIIAIVSYSNFGCVIKSKELVKFIQVNPSRGMLKRTVVQNKIDLDSSFYNGFSDELIKTFLDKYLK